MATVCSVFRVSMLGCSELNSVPSSYTQWTNKRNERTTDRFERNVRNEQTNEEGWGEKNKQRKWPSQLLCVCFVCSYFLLVRFCFLPHTVRGILSHYSVFNRTFNLFRCRELFALMLKSHFYLIFSHFGWMEKKTSDRTNERTNLLQFALNFFSSFIYSQIASIIMEKMRPNVFAWIILINYK